MERKKLTPSEMARQAGKKRRVQERTAARAARTSKLDGNFYSAMIVGIIAIWSVFIARALHAPPVYPIGIVTAPRVQLKDGRHVAYHEMGASFDEAKHQVLVLHGWRACRLNLLPNITEAELLDMGVRLVSYDRPGYGQSDPLPSRTAKTEAEDIAEIADLLNLGSSFHIVGLSMGGIPAWAALRYIPKRLKGVALLNPVGDYWSKYVSTDEHYDSWMWLVNKDRYSILIARHAPWLLPYWMTQTFITRAFWGGKGGVPEVAEVDQEILAWPELQAHFAETTTEAERQGPVESVYRDMTIAFGNWPFDITEVELGDDADFQGDVHIWQGAEDWIVPAPLNRRLEIALRGVNYTEVEDEGHFFVFRKGWSQRVLKELLALE